MIVFGLFLERRRLHNCLYEYLQLLRELQSQEKVKDQEIHAAHAAI